MNQYIKCTNCGAYIDSGRTTCPNCGAAVGSTPPPYTPKQSPTSPPTPNTTDPYMPNYQPAYSPQFIANDAFAASPKGCSRGIAGLLAIFLGGIGIHYFYMGKTTAGVIFLLCSVFTCGMLYPLINLIALAQGIYILLINNIKFYTTYVDNDETLPLF